MLVHYFAYGSNMNPDRVEQRGLRVRNIRSAALQHYELVFDKIDEAYPGAGHANVVRMQGATVEGVLYTLDGLEEILKMDRFERAPVNYGREAVRVSSGDQVDWAWTYFANAARRRMDLRPTTTYLAHLAAGADYLSGDYLQRLLAIDCLRP